MSIEENRPHGGDRVIGVTAVCSVPRGLGGLLAQTAQTAAQHSTEGGLWGVDRVIRGFYFRVQLLGLSSFRICSL